MRRLNLFHGLPGVWEEGLFFDTVWTQIRRQLDRGIPLNRSERLVLAALLDRLAASPEARKALGIKLRARTASRNERIADAFVRMRDVEGKKRMVAEAEVARAFPQVRPGALRSVIDSNEWLAPARARQLAEFLVTNNITGPIIKT
jgi:hypothetical protein